MKTTNPEIDPYLKQIAKFPLLTAEEEISLSTLARNGDAAAREHMINSNLRLVVSIAHRIPNSDMCLMDRISEGNIGLMKAVAKFDPSTGNRFSTYATWWIRQAIQRGIQNQSRTIRLPVHFGEKAAKVSGIAAQLSQELGRVATHEEIAEASGIDVEKISALLSDPTAVSRIDDPIGGCEDGVTLGSTIEDETIATPDMAAAAAGDIGVVRDGLAMLDDDERTAITLLFGLIDDVPLPMTKVCLSMGVSREVADRLTKSAMRKLRWEVTRKQRQVPASQLAAGVLQVAKTKVELVLPAVSLTKLIKPVAAAPVAPIVPVVPVAPVAAPVALVPPEIRIPILIITAPQVVPVSMASVATPKAQHSSRSRSRRRKPAFWVQPYLSVGDRQIVEGDAVPANRTFLSPRRSRVSSGPRVRSKPLAEQTTFVLF